MSTPDGNYISGAKEQDELYYNGKPTFQPRKIVSTPARGNAGTPATISNPAQIDSLPSLVPVAEAQAQFQALQTQFDKVATALDNRGSALTCANLSTVEQMQLRILRQKNDNETCWDFYKRMVTIARQYPTIEPDGNTFGEQLAIHGGDILQDPFAASNPISMMGGTPNYSSYTSGDPRADNYDQDPGMANLALMAFMAIIRLIIAAVLAVIGVMMNGGATGTGKSISDIASKTPNPTDLKSQLVPASPPPPSTGGSWPASVIGSIANIISGLINMVVPGGGLIAGVVSNYISVLVTPLIEGFIDQILGQGPKLATDVSRYDSIMISSHIQTQARTSMAPGWPEAVLLFSQFAALQEQYKNCNNIYDYFTQNSLKTSPSLGTTGSAPLMPSDLADVLGMHQKNTNDALDRMYNVLQGTVTTSGYCCMLQIIGSFDPSVLRTIQTILSLLMNTTAIKLQSIDSILNNLWQTIQNTILSLVLSIIFNLLQMAENDVKPIFTKAAQQFSANTGVNCLQFSYLTQSMLQYIEKLENLVLSLVMEFNNSSKLQSTYTAQYTQHLTENQELKLLNSLLEILINSKISGQICGSSNIPTNDELNQVFNQFSNSVNYQPLSPAGVNNPTPGTGNTSTSTAAGTTTASTSTSTSTSNNFANCLSKVSPEEAAQLQAWINQLQNLG